MVLIIALGRGLIQTGFISSTAIGELNRLTYWVGLPALLIERIGSAAPDFGSVLGILLVLVLATVVSITIAALVAGLWGMPGRSLVTFVHGAFRGNITFIGLPVVIYAFAGTAEASAYESAALVAFVPLVVVYNVVAVTLMQLHGPARMLQTARRVLIGLATNPILIGTVVGLGVALSDFSLPLVASRTLGAIGQMALPLALLGIGAGLQVSRLRGHLQWSMAAAFLKCSVGPAAGYVIGTALGLGSEELRLALIFLACPTAAAAYVLVQQMDGDVPLIASVITLSHLFALPAMLLALLLTA